MISKMYLIFFLSLVCLQTAEVVQYFLVKDQKKMPVRRAGTDRAARERLNTWQLSTEKPSEVYISCEIKRGEQFEC